MTADGRLAIGWGIGSSYLALGPWESLLKAIYTGGIVLGTADFGAIGRP
jgi:hypothetical protein